MPPSPRSETSAGHEGFGRPFLSPWRLGWVALVLFALYTTILLSAALPLRLSDPAWQLRLSSALVNTSAFPLLGLVLLHLAADLAPQSETLARRSAFFARLSVPIALGFLLLIPLQGFLLWQQSSAASGARQSRLQRLETNLDSVRQALQTATSSQDLQQRLKALRGPALSPDDQALPLPQLRARMQEALERADRELQHRRSALPPKDPLTLLQLGLRNAIACLALAIGFAALAQRRHAPTALLIEWQRALQAILNWRPWRGRRRSAASDGGMADYMEQLSREG